jgi:uncharacterized membrane protein
MSFPPGSSGLSLDAKVVVMGLVVAALTSAGNVFQKVNGLRGGMPLIALGGIPLVSVWLVLSVVCFFPTFLITNRVFLMGGKISLFVPVTATAYVMSMSVGRFAFGEVVPWSRWAGCGLILAGVAAVVRG